MTLILSYLDGLCKNAPNFQIEYTIFKGAVHDGIGSHYLDVNLYYYNRLVNNIQFNLALDTRTDGEIIDRVSKEFEHSLITHTNNLTAHIDNVIYEVDDGQIP